MICKVCGRSGGGHWMGCAEAGKPQEVAPGGGETIEGTPPEGTEVCAFAGCSRMRANRHPATKFCATHKDPKNRKI